MCLRYCFYPRAMKNACRTEAHTKGIWGASDSVQESATPRSCHARRSMSFQTLHKCCRILTSRSNVHCPGEMRRQFDGNQNSIKRGQESTAGKWGGRGDLAGRDGTSCSRRRIRKLLPRLQQGRLVSGVVGVPPSSITIDEQQSCTSIHVRCDIRFHQFAITRSTVAKQRARPLQRRTRCIHASGFHAAATHERTGPQSWHAQACSMAARATHKPGTMYM